MANLFWLSDEQWAVIDPFMPKDQPGPERKDDRQIITTSRRMKRGSNADSTDKNADVHSAGYGDPSAFLQLVTISGTAVALCGFVFHSEQLNHFHSFQ